LQGWGGARLAEILRVDHAGELGAVYIYRGQQAVFGASPSHGAMTDALSEMEGHEQVHLRAFDALLTERRVRPTLLAPVWRAAGFALGAGTALLGEKAAHACTEAVETVIEKHYADQIAELAEEDPALAGSLVKFREDELDHRDRAIAAGAQDAPGYRLLSAVIRMGCRAAIKITEKL
jgi:ubiquinone biosynthesis monooxygenase Coq7